MIFSRQIETIVYIIYDVNTPRKCLSLSALAPTVHSVLISITSKDLEITNERLKLETLTKKPITVTETFQLNLKFCLIYLALLV